MTQRTRATRADGVRSRAAILAAATQLASTRGLAGLSIADLAAAVGMSKSGLYAHFASKEDLQLATVGAATGVFVATVVTPAFQQHDPLARLEALCDGFLGYVERRVFPGGCFFVAASVEFGPRTGPVHDAIANAQRQWSELLRSVAERALDAGQLPRQTDTTQLAFKLAAVLVGANVSFVLHDDPALLHQAREAVRQLLHAG